MKLKRILATTVSLAMILGSTSASVFADEVRGAYKSTLKAAAIDASDVFGAPSDGIYTLKSGTYTLPDVVNTIGKICVPSGVTATIDLNGFAIDRGLNGSAVENGSIIEVESGGSLTVKNGTLRNSGNAGSGNSDGVGGGAKVFGSLILEDVTVTNCFGTDGGGGIYVGGSDASVELKGQCEIKQCYSMGIGTGVFVEDGQIIIEDSCSVTSNTSFAENPKGVGIYVSPNGKLSVAGSPNITMNGSNSNVYLSSGTKISVAGKLTTSARIGFSYEDEGKAPFTSGFGSKGNGNAQLQCFVPDFGGKTKILNSEVTKYYEYVDRSWDDSQKKIVSTTSELNEYTLIQSLDTNGSSCSLVDGNWYVVNTNTFTLPNRVDIEGEVNILLCDNCILVCNKGINLKDGSTLNVYGQSNDSGSLNCTGDDKDAGIGGNAGKGCGTLNIYGGNVNANGAGQSVGIGSGKNADMEGTIKVFGGNVSTNGGSGSSAGTDGAPGIGSGVDGNFTGSLIVYGGFVEAVGNGNAAGIGAAHFDADVNSGNMTGSVTVYGGEVSATGDGFGAGIGTSYSGASSGNGGNFAGKVLVYGGTVTALSGSGTTTEGGTTYNCCAPAIGSGTDTTTGTINIGDYMSVSKKGSYVAADDREKACRETGDENSYTWVRISKCEHGSCTYTPVSDAKHQKTCNHCLYEVVEDHAFGLDGTCPCGMSQAGSGTHLAGYSIILDGEIGVNFYVEFSADDVSNGDPYIEFSIPSGSTTKTHKVYIKEKAGEDRELATVDTTTISGKTYYVFKCPVAAKEMTSTITAQVSFGDTNGPTYTYCVKDYADYVLNHGSDPKYTNAVPLVKAMLNYGTYAQYYFGTNLNKLANADLAPNERSLGTVVIEHDACSVVGLPDQVTFEGANLYLKSGTILSLYFKNKSGSDVAFKLGNKEIVPKKNKGFLQIDIDIKSYELMNDFTITVGDGSVTYSPMNYCKTVLNGGTTYSSQLKDIVKALYRFAEAANAY